MSAGLMVAERCGAAVNVKTLRDASWRVDTVDGRSAGNVKLERVWSGEICKAKLVNSGSRAVRVKQAVLFDLRHGAVAFMAPYIADKSKWPQPPDVMYDQEWPMRQCSLVFAGLAFHNADYVELWRTLKADSSVEEVVRNFFIRQPVLWV